MKLEEKQRAIQMRKNGASIKEISKKLKISKGSISVWVRNVELTTQQKEELSKRGLKKDQIERRRNTRLHNEEEKRNAIVQIAKNEIKDVSLENLFFVGISLYCGEGSKTRRGIVEFSNSDPNLIQIMVRFFSEICDVKQEKFRGHIHIQKNQNIKRAELFWSNISSIPQKQFFKTSQQKSIASKNKRKTLPNGTFSIYVCDTKLFLKIHGWMHGLHEKIISKSYT